MSQQPDRSERGVKRGSSFKIGRGVVLALCPPLTIAADDFEPAFAILDGALGVVET
jgi:hypothetical protein